ncbi:toll/interleukin-1 receptor domain-containing protein [Algoriphagus sp. A40]|uniref:toll/interleukin-1 receptor domain-containing protein n=1 Tax=Algoriphagus sp. A40 TaxID=1945863 RepID=UPI0009850359|nr:toll/interleukin-1 receptor domain-containing protein [Algoriphagus sp. A40]OOG73037.1 hypothetical protein B0E43_14010 [Algoriphagus sp. A40]
MAQQEVFISYAWGGESENVADELEAVLSAKNIRLIRDKTDLGFKGLIRPFMEQIGQGNLVVLVISDKYLKSKNCMFELLEVEKKGEFFSRIFPVILPDADIYDSLGIINYLKHWDQKIKELNASVKELDNLADTRKVQEDINLYTDIRGAIDDLAGKLSNMNTLTVEIMRAKNYQPLVDSLLKENEIGQPNPLNPTSPRKKEGKILFHIPGMMQVEKWTRCTIRLAWEELLLTEGLKIPEEDRIIESIRLGNVMQVSLNEGRDGHNFEIKSLNNEEQVIFEDDFTEWLFDVKPLTLGNFVLILRVTVIQIIEGKERKKDIVLERNVITEAVVPKALARFETAEKGLVPPEVGKGNPSLIKIEEMLQQSKDYYKVYPELSDEEEKPATQPRISNRPSSKSDSFQIPTTSNPLPIPPNPKSAYSESQPSPKAKSTTFRKILPYAASLALLVVVGALFFPRFDSQYSQEYEASSPHPEKYPQEYEVSSPNLGSVDISLPETDYDEKILVALSLESTDKSGKTSKEVLLFMIGSEKLDSLDLLDPGNFSLQIFPASDTLGLNLGYIPEYSILAIQDSVQKTLSDLNK